MRSPVVKPLDSINVQTSFRRSGLRMKREPTEAAPLITSIARHSRVSHRSVRRSRAASPDHLLSVGTMRHTPAAAMRWTEGRAAPSVRRFPEEPGVQRAARTSGSPDTRSRRNLSSRLQLRAVGYDAVLDKAPQRDHQLPRHGDNANPPAPPAGRREPAREPRRQRAVRLPA